MTLIYGVDTSHYSGDFDVAAAAAKGCAFVIPQLTVGDGFLDPQGLATIKKSQGLHTGAYHFLTGADGAAQCDHFLRHLPDGVLPVLDIEPKQGATRAAALAFIDRWDRQRKDKPVLYSGPGAFATVMGSRSLNVSEWFRFLWNADYRFGHVTSPDDRRFDVYYGSTASGQAVYGYGGFTHAPIVQFGGMFGADGNAFDGTPEQLAALFGDAPLPQPEPVTYRYGGIPWRRGTYTVLAPTSLRYTPAYPAADPQRNRLGSLRAGDTFRALQSVKHPNGRIWLGDDTGAKWILDDERVKAA